MRLKSMNPSRLWTDYVITNQASGKSYRLALRGWQPGESYCSCPDFRKNTLGTCKHIIYALKRGRAKFSRKVQNTPATVDGICVYLKYGRSIELRLLLPGNLKREVKAKLGPLQGKVIEDPKDLLLRIGQVERLGASVTIYPDAEEYMQQKLFQARMAAIAGDIRRDPAAHPLRSTLLKAKLRPYQLAGIAFCPGALRDTP